MIEDYKKLDEEYYDCIKDLVENVKVLKMDEFIQHGNTSCLKHCLAVSYKSYRFAKTFNLDYKAVARAALLHDFFLYDWHHNKKKKHLFQKHGYIHPKIALENAIKYFDLTPKEQDIILKHMWPLTLRSIPKYKESMLVCFVDKYISSKETLKYHVLAK